MKKPYEFTFDDDQRIIYLLNTSILTAIEQIRAFRSIADLSDKDDSDKTWAILNSLIDARANVAHLSCEIEWSLANDERDRKIFYANRDKYVEMANLMLSQTKEHYRDILTNMMANVAVAVNGKDLEMAKVAFETAQDELSEMGAPYIGHPTITKKGTNQNG